MLMYLFLSYIKDKIKHNSKYIFYFYSFLFSKLNFNKLKFRIIFLLSKIFLVPIFTKNNNFLQTKWTNLQLLP